MAIHLEQPVHAADHVRGDLLAPITLVEYGDFECHYCALAYPVLRELLARFPRDLRFVFRHAPQTRLHPNAELAAQAAEAAGVQGKFWEFHDSLFEHPGARDWAHLLANASMVQLDIERFRGDVQGGRFREVVRAFELSGAHTVRGTPTYFIDGIRYEGPSDLESFTRVVAASRDERMSCERDSTRGARG